MGILIASLTEVSFVSSYIYFAHTSIISILSAAATLSIHLSAGNLSSPTMTVSTGCDASDSKSAFVGSAPLQAVLFDVDGTLCDSDPIHLEAFHIVFKEAGLDVGVPVDEDYYIKHFAGKHNDELAHFLYPDDVPRGIKFMEDKEANFRRLSKEKLKPIDGLHELCKWIEDRGLKRAAVTNAPRPNAEQMIAAVGLTDFFQALIIGDECEHAKPHPEPYLKALEVLDVPKEHSIIFEDSFSGITAGVAAGIPVAGLSYRNPEEILIQAKPALLIKTYADPKLWAALEELDKKSASNS